MLRAFVLILAASLVAGAASATTIRGFTTEQMVREAALVVRATVLSQQGRYNAARTKIYTDSTLRVREVLAGPKVQEITVRQLGGVVGDAEMLVPGTATLPVGADVVLFLRERGGIHYLVGMAQGAFVIRKDAQGIERVSRDLSGLHVLPPRVPFRPRRSEPAPPATWSELASRVRALAVSP